MGYGTGAIMAVPAHDTRDYEFAKKFGIDIIEVIKGGDISKEAYTGEGECVNSGFLDGIKNKKEAIEKIADYLSENSIGEKDEGLGIQPSALLGRADSDRLLPALRHGSRSL